MRRVLTFLLHKAQWWRSQATLREDGCDLVKRGLSAYAEKQASLQEELAENFAVLWLKGIEDAGLPPPVTWPPSLLTVTPRPQKVQHRWNCNKLVLQVQAGVETEPVQEDDDSEEL